MPEKATVIKEIQSRFTANITDYRKKVEQLSGLVANMTKNLDAVQRTAASAMKSPSESTQKLGRALDATVRKLQGQKEKFDGLTKSGERTAQQMEQLSQKLAGMSSAYHAIQAAADTIDLSTPIQKQADAAKVAVEQIDVKIEGLAAALKSAGQNKFVFLDSGEMLSIDQARARLEQLAQSGVEAAGKLDQLQEAIQSIGTENLGYASAKGLEQLKSRIDATTSKLGSLGDKMSGTATKAEHLAGSMRETKEKLDQQSESLSKSSRRFDALKNAVGRFASSAGNGLSTVRNRIAGIGASASGSTSRVERLLRSIRRISLASLALRVVRPIFGELTSCVNRYMEQNAAAAASIERLRNGLTNALAPAINVVINLLNQIMPYLIGIADAVASLITNIFGTGWTTVSTGGAAAANSVADSAGKASDKVDDLADSTNDAAAAQEKYNKLIAGFDEITKLEEQPSAAGGSDGAGGGSGGSGEGSGGATQTTAPGTEGIAGKLPEWLSNLANQLKELFEAQDFTGIGELLATKFGDLVDYLDAKLTDPAFQQKVSNACQHIVDGINGFFTEMTYSDGTRESIATRTGNLIGDALSLCLNTLDQFLTGVTWDKIGITVAQNINGALETLNDNDVKFGTIIADLINAGIDALSGFANTLSWSEIGTFIAENVNSFFETTDWGKAGETATNLISGLFTLVNTAFTSVDWNGIGEAVGELLCSVKWGKLLVDASTAICNGLIAGLDVISGLVSEIKEQIEDHDFTLDDLGAVIDVGELAIDVLFQFAATANEVWDIAKWLSAITSPFRLTVQLSVELVQKGLSALWDLLLGGKTEEETATTTNPNAQAGRTQGLSLNVDMKANDTTKQMWDETKSNWEKTTKGRSLGSSSKVTDVKNPDSSKTTKVRNYISGKVQSTSKVASITSPSTSLLGRVRSYILNKLSGISPKVRLQVSKLKIYQSSSGITKGIGSVFAKMFATGGVVNGPTYAMLGEAGREAVVPLKNNTEWTGVVAKLITKQMSTMPNTYSNVPMLYSGNPNDLSELVTLIRELRSDVAAIKQGEKKLSVTVQNNLDGQKLADNTVTRIIQQTRATGVNPLSAYI